MIEPATAGFFFFYYRLLLLHLPKTQSFGIVFLSGELLAGKVVAVDSLNCYVEIVYIKLSHFYQEFH